MAYPVRGSEDPTPDEVRARILAHARGETHFAIASRFKISPSASIKFKRHHLPEIEAEAEKLQGVILDRTSELRVNDQVAQAELRQYLAEDICRAARTRIFCPGCVPVQPGPRSIAVQGSRAGRSDQAAHPG